MDKYIQRLINDIRESRTRIIPPDMNVWANADLGNESEVEDLSYVEEAIYGQPEPISVITGIETGYLPVDNVLTDVQKALLSTELEALLNHYNFYPNFPENFPDELKYKHLRAVWDSERVHVSFGKATIELCEFNPETCPFAGYCTTCEEMQSESREGQQINETDFLDEDILPF